MADNIQGNRIKIFNRISSFWGHFSYVELMKWLPPNLHFQAMEAHG